MGAGLWRIAAAAVVTLAGSAGLAAGQAGLTAPAGPQPQPVRPGVPGTAREELGIDRPPPLVREGAFVSSARGVVVRGQSGRWYIVFDEDARGRKMPPMVVLPGPHLAALERLASRMGGEEAAGGTGGAGGARLRILVTGQVLAYQGHNYLLPTAAPILETTLPGAEATPEPAAKDAEERAGGAEGGEAEPAEETGAAGVDAGGEPSIDQIIGELDRALGTRRASNPIIAADHEGTAGENGAARVRPAGFMTARRGRIMRTGAGDCTFVVDAGTAGEVAEPPMMLLPCTNLSAIESIAERMGEAATFTISGQVIVYKGRNYLLPTTYTVNRVTDQVLPTQ